MKSDKSRKKSCLIKKINSNIVGLSRISELSHTLLLPDIDITDASAVEPQRL